MIKLSAIETMHRIHPYIFSLFALSWFSWSEAAAQYPLFDHPDRMALVKRGGDFIYNMEEDSALIYIKKIRTVLPEHPIVPFMEGVRLLWLHVPVLNDSVFNRFISKMNEVVANAQALGGGDEEHSEAIFFELAAHGLMAEYYADKSQYMKALNAAGKAYKLVKQGFERTDEINEFLFTTGLYNYFREKYPQVYPVFKPFMWVFKPGDMKLGLRQLDEATRTTVISRIEAYVYIAYIYLRYEDDPEKAQEYLAFLVRQYPNNLYIATKYLESLRGDEAFAEVSVGLFDKLQASNKPYFQMAGSIFRGLYEEKVRLRPKTAFRYYVRGIEQAERLPSHGELYRSLAYLGMGRILKREQPDKARVYLNKALETAETKDVKKEARKLLR